MNLQNKNMIETVDLTSEPCCLSERSSKELLRLIKTAGLQEKSRGMLEKKELISLLGDYLSNDQILKLLMQIHREDTKWQPFYLIHSEGIEARFNERTLRFADIFSGNFRSALVSNFQVELEFILGACPRLSDPDVSVCLLHGLESWDADMRSELRMMDCNITLGLVKTYVQFGSHHCKYALLFYDNGVRVIITTANFIQTDFLWLSNVSKLLILVPSSSTRSTSSSTSII